MKSAFYIGEKRDALGQDTDHDTFTVPTQRRYYHLQHQQRRQFGDRLRKIYRLNSDASGHLNSQWDPERRRTLSKKLLVSRTAIIASLRVSLGPGETTVTRGAPCRLPHPRGIAGSLRHCGARGSLPPLVFTHPSPLDGPV